MTLSWARNAPSWEIEASLWACAASPRRAAVLSSSTGLGSFITHEPGGKPQVLDVAAE